VSDGANTLLGTLSFKIISTKTSFILAVFAFTNLYLMVAEAN